VQRANGQAAMVSAGQTAAAGSASNLDSTQLGVTVASGSGTWNQGDPIVVTVTYPYSISLLGLVVSNGTLTSSTTMRAE